MQVAGSQKSEVRSRKSEKQSPVLSDQFSENSSRERKQDTGHLLFAAWFLQFEFCLEFGFWTFELGLKL